MLNCAPCTTCLLPYMLFWKTSHELFELYDFVRMVKVHIVQLESRIPAGETIWSSPLQVSASLYIRFVKGLQLMHPPTARCTLRKDAEWSVLMMTARPELNLNQLLLDERQEWASIGSCPDDQNHVAWSWCGCFLGSFVVTPTWWLPQSATHMHQAWVYCCKVTITMCWQWWYKMSKCLAP